MQGSRPHPKTAIRGNTPLRDAADRKFKPFYGTASDTVSKECNDGTNTATITLPAQLAGKQISFLGTANGQGAMTWVVESKGTNTTVENDYLPTM